MKRFTKGLVIVSVLLVMGSLASDVACFGACHGQCGKHTCACVQQRDCCPPCCTAPQPCPRIVYEEKECTAYKTVFEEVIDKVPVDAVKYVEETAYRCVPVTVMQPPTVAACQPAKACAD